MIAVINIRVFLLIHTDLSEAWDNRKNETKQLYDNHLLQECSKGNGFGL
jgi:hypothetical protein